MSGTELLAWLSERALINLLPRIEASQSEHSIYYYYYYYYDYYDYY